jgi:hypothetical protein
MGEGKHINIIVATITDIGPVLGVIRRVFQSCPILHMWDVNFPIAGAARRPDLGIDEIPLSGE